MLKQKVAIVTGSNKGIGKSIVKKLCQGLSSDWHVFLTSRDESRGKAAVEDLKSQGANPEFHLLDVSNRESIQRLADFVKKTYGGLDILVNNAAIAYPIDSTVPIGERAEVMMRTNFWGLLDMCDAMFPLLRPHARVVHVASGGSDHLLNSATPELQRRLTSQMSLEEVKNLMTEYVEAAKQGKQGELGWPDMFYPAYCATKVGVRLLTYAQAKLIEQDTREDIVINSVCPGYVGTDLNAHQGVLTPDEGADTPVYAATLPHNPPKELIGKHFYKREVVPFTVGAEQYKRLIAQTPGLQIKEVAK